MAFSENCLWFYWQKNYSWARKGRQADRGKVKTKTSDVFKSNRFPTQLKGCNLFYVEWKCPQDNANEHSLNIFSIIFYAKGKISTPTPANQLQSRLIHLFLIFVIYLPLITSSSFQTVPTWHLNASNFSTFAI